MWSYGFYHPHTNVGLPQGGARRATPESRAIRPGQPLCVALCPTAALRYHSSVGWNTWFRKRRMRRFARELQVTAGTRVLDVGGTPETWDMLPVRPRVTLLNTPRTKTELAGASWWVAGDGRALPFRDAAFDVVFSNSVIEHVGDAQSQQIGRASCRERV